MRRHILPGLWLLIFLILISSSRAVWAAVPPGSPVHITLEGVPLATDAYIDSNGRTMVPLRFVAEGLGFKVDWTSTTRQVTVRGDNCDICLRVGEKRALVGGRERALDTVPVVYQERTMVPLRFVAETLGLAVQWDGSTRTVALHRLPGEETEQQAWIEVTGDVVNVRAGPATSYQVVTQVRAGDKLLTLGSSQGWYRVSLSDGKEGWIAGWLTKEAQAPQAETGKRRVAVVTADAVNLRAGPGTNYAVVTVVHRYTQLDIEGRKGDWYQVAYGDHQGWIAGWLVAVRVIDTASRTEEPGEERPPSTPDEPDELTPPAGAPTQRVLDIDREAGGEELSIEIQTTGQVVWATGRLTQPDRLYVDLAPAVLDDELTDFDKKLAAGPVARLRAGQFAETTTRLVLDLRRKDVAWKEIRFDSSESVLYLVVGPADLGGRTIVLDPGHGLIQTWGGSDPGAIGPSGLKERDVVLAVASEAAQLLSAKGATVLMTSTEEITTLDLYQRADLANRSGADVFVSIHANANPSPSLGGTSTYFYVPPDLPDQGPARRSLASTLQRSLVAELGLEDKGILQANFAVLRATSMPSALVELAFISNPTEERLLADPDFQAQAAQAVAQGITDFLLQQ